MHGSLDVRLVVEFDATDAANAYIKKDPAARLLFSEGSAQLRRFVIIDAGAESSTRLETLRAIETVSSIQAAFGPPPQNAHLAALGFEKHISFDGAETKLALIDTSWTTKHPVLDGRKAHMSATGTGAHGLAALGVAVGNNGNYRGFAPRAELAALEAVGAGETFDAVARALANLGKLQAGTVVLVPMELGPGKCVTLYRTAEGNGVDRTSARHRVLNSYPIDIGDCVQAATRTLTKNGVIVVEAAGNSAVPLTPWPNKSGAIVVGAAVDGQLASNSSSGERVDCYGPGWVLAPTPGTGFGEFKDTSAAAACIAGAALILQQAANLYRGAFLTPAQMRGLLSDPNLGVQITNAQPKPVGVMPQVDRIIDALKDRSFPLP